MAIFKGFKQVFQSEYNATPDVDKKGYMWLVREGADATDGKIYFGTRLYTPLSMEGGVQDAYTKAETNQLLGTKADLAEFEALTSLVSEIMNLIGLEVTEDDVKLTLSEAFEDSKSVVDALELLAKKLGERENELTGVQESVTAAQADATQALADAAAAQAAAATAQEAAAAAQTTADEAKGKIDAFLGDNDLTEGVVDTLKEIQEYISKDGAAADKLTQDIASAQADATQALADAAAAKAAAATAQEAADAAQADATKALADIAEFKGSVEEGAQVNKIEKVKLFGTELTVDADKSVNVDFQANDVKLGSAITSVETDEETGESSTVTVYDADAKVTDVLQGIYNALKSSNGGGSGALNLEAGDASVVMGGDSLTQTVKVQISAAEGNRLMLNTEDGKEGLYVEPLYYEGDDAEV